MANLLKKKNKKLKEIHDYDYSETTDFINMKEPLTLKDLGLKPPKVILFKKNKFKK